MSKDFPSQTEFFELFVYIHQIRVCSLLDCTLQVLSAISLSLQDHKI